MNSASRIGFGFAAMGVALVAVYVVTESRVAELEEKVATLEGRLATLGPIENVMRGYRPTGGKPGYGAGQATGAPDVGAGAGDSGKAWCPDVEDGGEEWLEVGYGGEHAAVAVRVVENLNGGGVVRLEAAGEVVWEGANVAGEDIVLAEPVVIDRLTVVVDTGKVKGWNEIDAVGLVREDASVVWAVEATASSSWGQGGAGGE